MGRTIRFTNRPDTFTQGTSENNIELTLYLLGGDDRVELDRVDEQAGGHWVDMGRGNDYLTSIEGGNVIFLGDGNDTYVAGMTNFSTNMPGDRVNGGAGKDFFVVFTEKSRYLGGAGDDKFLTLGWQNRFEGGNGKDSISYAAFDGSPGGRPVTIDLGAGRTETGPGLHDTLISIEYAVGTDLDDTIRGSAVANRLVGSEGIDTLTGRAGADTFVWRTADEAPIEDHGMDRITDFRRSQGDKIDLRLVDAKEGGFVGKQDFTFIGDRAFTDKAGQLAAVRQGADVVLRGDIDGDGTADFRIRLIGINHLNADDLLL